MTLKTVRLLIILLQIKITSSNSTTFVNVEDKTKRCYTCVNTTGEFDECAYNSLKSHTCVSYLELLNRKHVEGYQLFHITFKCATIKYSGRYNQMSYKGTEQNDDVCR